MSNLYRVSCPGLMMESKVESKFDHIPKRELTAERLFRKGTILCGPARTGKTTLAKHCMGLARPHVGDVILVVPDLATDAEYESKLPIHRLVLPGPEDGKTWFQPFSESPIPVEGFEIETFLKDLWEKQEKNVGKMETNGDCFDVLLVFDGCVSQLKSVFSTEIFRKVFLMGAHARISAIITCHSDTEIPVNLRKNADLMVLTHQNACLEYTARLSNSVAKKERDILSEACPVLFSERKTVTFVCREEAGFSYGSL